MRETAGELVSGSGENFRGSAHKHGRQQFLIQIYGKDMEKLKEFTGKWKFLRREHSAERA